MDNFNTYTLFKVAVVGPAIWARGRESLKNKRKKELEKMKLYDIN